MKKNKVRPDKTPTKIQKMFNSIAKKYDRLNDFISLGFHKKIKLEALKLLDFSDLTPYDKVLDLCAGTGDILILLNELLEKKLKKNQLVGVDFSSEMLSVAKNRIKNSNFKNKIDFVQADCTELPFLENSFSKVTICWGLRNIKEQNKAIKEIKRVLKQNGEILHLDFGEKNAFSKVFDFLTPIFAKIFLKDISAYNYLIQSKKDFLSPKELIEEFQKEKTFFLKQ